MSSAFDTLLPASFDGTIFPVQEISIEGGYRYAVHEYPHRDGGSPEKIGLRLYKVKVQAVFANTFPAYQSPPLWPDRLRTLNGTFETGATKLLTLPTVGTMKAFATDWDRTMNPSSGAKLSGEAVTFSFLQDPDDVIDLDGLFTVGQSNLTTALDNLSDELEDSPDLLSQLSSAFQSIQDAVNDVLAIKDTFDVYSSVIASKLAYVSSLCDQIDQLATLQDPAYARVLSALQDVWASSIRLGQDLTGSGDAILVYTTPRIMSVGEISAAIFGDASHAGDLLDLNGGWADALAIPSGSAVKHFST